MIFAWVLGVDKGWKELNRGGDIRIPKVFKFILKYITPTYLIVLLVLWFVLEGWDFITLKNLEEQQVQFMWWEVSNKRFITSIRVFFVLILAGINFLIFRAWKKYNLDDKLKIKVEE